LFFFLTTGCTTTREANHLGQFTNCVFTILAQFNVSGLNSKQLGQGLGNMDFFSNFWWKCVC